MLISTIVELNLKNNYTIGKGKGRVRGLAMKIYDVFEIWLAKKYERLVVFVIR